MIAVPVVHGPLSIVAVVDEYDGAVVGWQLAVSSLQYSQHANYTVNRGCSSLERPYFQVNGPRRVFHRVNCISSKSISGAT